MSGTKNKATGEKDSVKIAELGEELKVDPREIVAAAKDMSMENAKVPASWVSSGQADRLRAKFGGHKELKAQLERKQRFLESGKLDEPGPVASVKSRHVEISPKAYEAGRRSIFGVVETPGGERIESAAPKGLHAKPAVSGITRPAPEAPATPNTVSDISAAAAQPAKKFIGITVAPPVRRAGEVDPRFGVVSAAPEPEKTSSGPAPLMNLWGKLNDGRAPLEMHAPQQIIETLQPIDEPELPEPEPAVRAPAHAAHVEVEEVIAAPEAHKQHADKHHPVQLPPKIHEVPVKVQPRHKAFGAKHKVKHKQSKHHNAVKDPKSKHDAVPEKREKKTEPKKESQRRPAAAAHTPPARQNQPEGLLKRLARKLLGK